MLQTTAVFTNVSKGILAKHEDLTDVFGTQDEEQICIRILNEGDYQARPLLPGPGACTDTSGACPEGFGCFTCILHALTVHALTRREHVRRFPAESNGE